MVLTGPSNPVLRVISVSSSPDRTGAAHDGHRKSVWRSLLSGGYS